MKFLALDVGEKRIGVARGDDSTRIAIPVGFVETGGGEWAEITRIANFYGTKRFIVGLPRNNQGQETAQTAYVREFVRQLVKRVPGVKVKFQDETLTSVLAEDRLKQSGKPYQKGDIDAEAATIILQDFLEGYSNRAGNTGSLAQEQDIQQIQNSVNNGYPVQNYGDVDESTLEAAVVPQNEGLDPNLAADLANMAPEESNLNSVGAEGGSGMQNLASAGAEYNSGMINSAPVGADYAPETQNFAPQTNEQQELGKEATMSNKQRKTAKKAQKQAKKATKAAKKAQKSRSAGSVIGGIVTTLVILVILGVAGTFGFLYLRDQRRAERAAEMAAAEAAMEPEVFTFTVKPGETIYDIQANLVAAGYSETEVEQALAAKYDFPMLKGRPTGATLEGYLFGETSEFYKSATATEVISFFLEEMQKTINQNNLEVKFANQGLTLDEGITLASVVQKEANTNDMPTVAQVFLSRLSQGMALGSDVTVSYAIDTIDPDRDGFSDNQTALSVDSCYNTRLYKGLPCGPISSPGINALLAVANPSDTSYLYFLTGDDGLMYYSYTEDEHTQNAAEHCQDLCQVSL